MKDCYNRRLHSPCNNCAGHCNKLPAGQDIWRLRINWAFVIMSLLLRGVNLLCVIPTNHQFIINPTRQTLQRLNGSNDIEPGLEESETFYTLTYTVLFFGHATGSIISGILFNCIPTWYLFLFSTISCILGYLIYALATTSWMMLVARGLAGIQLGSSTALAFAYFGISFEKFRENVKALREYDEKKMTRTRKYLFSTYSIGSLLGKFFGLGFPLIMAQFPSSPQFRTAGWFCVATGVAILLLQLLMFHGECAWKCHIFNRTGLRKQKVFFKSQGKWSYFDIFVKVIVPIYVIIVGGLKGMRYAVNEVLVSPIVTDLFGFSDEDMAYIFIINVVGAAVALILLWSLQCLRISSYLLTVVGMVCTIIGLLIMTDWQSLGRDPCIKYSLFDHPGLADQYKLQLAESNVSESGMVRVQSLQVVEGEVYQLAVNKCEAAGTQCHWIPNSLVTGENCNDCQPMCRSTKRTLNFVQFVIGLFFFYATLPLMFTGIYLLLSESVSKPYQGISSGVMTALMGASRSVFPLILDYAYERDQKTTHLSMLIQVGFMVPLLGGLLLLYPCLAGKYKVNYFEQIKEAEEEDREKLIDPK